MQKITIVPHTEGSLGYTLLMPEEDKTNLRTRDELIGHQLALELGEDGIFLLASSDNELEGGQQVLLSSSSTRSTPSANPGTTAWAATTSGSRP